MRVFLSAYPSFTLAIPMDAVGSMMLYNKETEKNILYDQEKRNTYVSLPGLFNMKDKSVYHGIILRGYNSNENKIVLLTAEVKRDTEIPDDEFYPIPKTLGTMNFASMFKGIQFSGSPVLLLNIENLIQIVQKDKPPPEEKKPDADIVKKEDEKKSDTDIIEQKGE